jgi:hypothetical protein
MDQYRVYLKGELGKLKNRGDAEDFIAKSSWHPGDFGLQRDAGQLMVCFPDQRAVNDYVESLDDAALIGLTWQCCEWRRNPPGSIMRPGQRLEWRRIPVEEITLTDAERDLIPRFHALGRRLVAIAHDDLVLNRYSRGRRARKSIAYEWLLAQPPTSPGGAYFLFDGVHRAVQMVVNGRKRIPLCVVFDS